MKEIINYRVRDFLEPVCFTPNELLIVVLSVDERLCLAFVMGKNSINDEDNFN